MPSPFPGMDPYLEGEEWSDFYQRFATTISDYLTPQMRPYCVARLAFDVIADLPMTKPAMISHSTTANHRRHQLLMTPHNAGLLSYLKIIDK